MMLQRVSLKEKMRKYVLKLHRQVVRRRWYTTTSFLSRKTKNKPIVSQSQITAGKTMVFEMDKSQKEWKQAQFFAIHLPEIFLTISFFSFFF